LPAICFPFDHSGTDSAGRRLQHRPASRFPRDGPFSTAARRDVGTGWSAEAPTNENFIAPTLRAATSPRRSAYFLSQCRCVPAALLRRRKFRHSALALGAFYFLTDERGFLPSRLHASLFSSGSKEFWNACSLSKTQQGCFRH
jgi:hypothetical protein